MSGELPIKVKTNTTTTHRFHVTIDRAALLELMVAAGHTAPQLRTARIWVHVPGGGDWSNTDLNIEEAPINITWEETEETHS